MIDDQARRVRYYNIRCCLTSESGEQLENNIANETVTMVGMEWEMEASPSLNWFIYVL